MMSERATRKAVFLFLCMAFLVLPFVGCNQSRPTAQQQSGSAVQKEPVNNKGVLRIGYQKTGALLLLKHRKTLEEILEPLGYTVAWSEFNTGLAVVEALSAGNIDFGNVGDAPSLFGLARGLDFVYVASEPSAPQAEGILVKEDSPIQTVADLKGKKVAFNKASISQYLLTKALASAGMSMSDVEPVYLAPSDASIAFAQGEVDAWVVWDPYFTVAAENGNRILTDGKGLVPYRTFYLSRKEYVDQHPDVIKQVVEELQKAGKQINENPREAADLLSKATKIPVSVWEKVLHKKRSDANFMDQQAVDDLEVQADDFLNIGLIDKKVQVADAVWRP
ncbi:MAG: sulfonate ABC transporter substrate-binding protein [Bacillus thermozeamaize]|uniref:Putative aliphatic sulfonates-binding protein n=1 Tax=Bacillus thermozeamaize TaxID=230954 RepID=A0A1Y3PHI5_9BACI|nr:MAG: sulfonate ABC transporter substrate-binding protein [Bacillus thermozeamaize]